jgi:hypothetical protein
MGQVTNPAPRPAQEDHPLLQNVDLSETQILTTTVLSATGWSQVVVAAEIQPNPPTLQPSNLPTAIPLLLAGEFEGRRVAILAFSLQQSDLPLRPAFPLLVANLVNYLAPGIGALIPATLAPGEALALAVPSQVTHLRLADSAGFETIVTAQAGRVSLPPLQQPGFYSLTFEPAGAVPAPISPVSLAVNFFNPLESDITPQPELNLTGPIPAGPSGLTLPPAHRERWRPLVLGALVLLVVEWFVYQRSTVFKVWNTLPWRGASK